MTSFHGNVGNGDYQQHWPTSFKIHWSINVSRIKVEVWQPSKCHHTYSGIMTQSVNLPIESLACRNIQKIALQNSTDRCQCKQCSFTVSSNGFAKQQSFSEAISKPCNDVRMVHGNYFTFIPSTNSLVRLSLNNSQNNHAMNSSTTSSYRNVLVKL